MYADPSLQAGPLWLAAIRAADAVHAHAALAWLVVAGGSALVAVTLWRIVAAHRHGPLLAAAGTTALALGLPYFAYTSGHAAQLLIPLLWLNASLEASRGRAGRAALLVGVSAGIETWGLLGLPLLLTLPRPVALRAAAGAFAVAAASYLPFVLAGEFRMGEYRWRVADGTLASLLVDGEFPWSLRLAQGALAVGAAAAIVLATRGSITGGNAAAGAAVSVRLLLDPELHGWYWIAPQILAVALGVSVAATPAWLRRGAASRRPAAPPTTPRRRRTGATAGGSPDHGRASPA